MAEQEKAQELSSESLEGVAGGYYNPAAVQREIREKRAAGMTLNEYLRYVRGGIGSMSEAEWLEMQDYIIDCWND